MPKLGGSYTPDCIVIFSSGEHLPHNFGTKVILIQVNSKVRTTHSKARFRDQNIGLLSLLIMYMQIRSCLYTELPSKGPKA